LRQNAASAGSPCEVGVVTWVYRQIGQLPPTFQTGYYRPDGKWIRDHNYDRYEVASARVHYLNGGTGYGPFASFYKDPHVPPGKEEGDQY